MPMPATGAPRRSSRIERSLPVKLIWIGQKTESLQEETATLSISCHGCRSFTRHYLVKNSRISVYIIDNKEDTAEPAIHQFGRVAWVRKSQRMT
ncbi:MAG: hypothetical protein ACRD4Y_04800, partial [Candidatus Acidiferrales bacterium]